MKYLKLFESFGDYVCDKYNITNYTINEDGTIDVRGDVNLSSQGLNELPVRFRNVSGDFFCDDNQLISLEGCPKSVGGGFWCNNNQLSSLEGCPQSVGGDFICYNNQLMTLEGCPQNVGGDFYCNNNWLVTLEGGPEEVGGYFDCDCNKLISLDGCPKSVGDFYCSSNPCTSIYNQWIDTDRRDELMDMMKDYDFLRGDTINWYLLEAFFNDTGLKIPSRSVLEKYYTIEE
jgi:hypothetical protein